MTFSSQLLQSPLLIKPSLSVKTNSSSPPMSPKLQRSSIIASATTFCTSPAEREITTSFTVASSTTSFYELLGIQMGATSDEIKAAYRRLAKVYHPDVVAIDRKSDEFVRLHAAYSTLSDPNKRANYDRMIFRRHRSSVSFSDVSPLSPRFNGYTCRNWETDQCW